MKVCIISDTFPPTIGGIETFAQGLANQLSLEKKVEKVTVITFGKKLVGSEKPSEKLEVLRMPQARFFGKGWRIIGEVLKRRDHDILHAMTLLASGFYVGNLNRFLGKRFFVSVFGLDALQAFRLGWKYRFPIKLTFNAADRIIAFSNAAKEEIRKAYGLREDKFSVIYPGISVPSSDQEEIRRIRKKYSIDKDDFVVLFVGRLVKRKGVDDLIWAIKKIDDEKIKLLIVGDGKEKGTLTKLKEKLGLQKKVFFVGSVPRLHTFLFYGLANVFCMPSKYLREEGDIEGLGIVFLEAQSYGVPVIGTRSGGIPEAIDDGKSGFVVPEGDPDSIKEKLLDLMSDKKLRDEMGKHAIKFVERKFNWRKCVNAHIELYEER